MKQQTYTLLTHILSEEHNTLLASKLHLEHQLSLMTHLRVNEMTTDEMEESVQQLNLRIAEIKDAIEDIYSDYEASNLRAHQGYEQGDIIPGTHCRVTDHP